MARNTCEEAVSLEVDANQLTYVIQIVYQCVSDQYFRFTVLHCLCLYFFDQFAQICVSVKDIGGKSRPVRDVPGNSMEDETDLTRFHLWAPPVVQVVVQ